MRVIKAAGFSRGSGDSSYGNGGRIVTGSSNCGVKRRNIALAVGHPCFRETGGRLLKKVMILRKLTHEACLFSLPLAVF